MKIPSTTTVALVGASGCGKSTIIQLLQSFYDPEHGKILLDGRDIRTLKVAWLQSHVGIVSQEPALFTGSIEENIRFGKMDASHNEGITAAKMANALDFIMKLPENHKTTSSGQLSGGQQQRGVFWNAPRSRYFCAPKVMNHGGGGGLRVKSY
ncbi:unnamed protein product [Didymodactylos carnosus]|uniref:ABC transporter domain-containing protein n=1 Tax=Didymodactylos carnosus TaxID=1234261 RepID=A0A815CUF7_9BILA|nr:unnamed protein product [Didymodactylos carnosus]CAF1291960.1 unnamed protein product [Didymodactylos carnosus]CAF3755331.1 unnamed protein product [Didymodactylos carnosus]CAF4099037.1 unnamed protein product [Didymodactylos carnosus]